MGILLPVWLLLLTLLSLHPVCSQPSWCGSEPRHLVLAEQFVGTREVGRNRGEWIDVWNRYVGVPKGSPYCAAFVSWCIGQSGATEPKVKSGLARHFWTKAKKQYRYSSGEVLRGLRQVMRGDIIIWSRGSTIYGHAGFARKDWAGKSGQTIEANTSAGVGSQWDGDGVHIRFRKIEPYNYFRIIGFAEVRYN